MINLSVNISQAEEHVWQLSPFMLHHHEDVIDEDQSDKNEKEHDEEESSHEFGHVTVVTPGADPDALGMHTGPTECERLLKLVPIL